MGPLNRQLRHQPFFVQCSFRKSDMARISTNALYINESWVRQQALLRCTAPMLQKSLRCTHTWYMTTSLGVPWSLSWSLRLSRCRQSLHTRSEVSGDGPATLLLGVLKAVRFISFPETCTDTLTPCPTPEPFYGQRVPKPIRMPPLHSSVQVSISFKMMAARMSRWTNEHSHFNV